MAHGDAPTIKLILTDIDDTVMPRGMTAVSERTVRAFRAARDAGITVGPSSGRGRAQIVPFFRNDEACFSTAITTNGLEIYAAGEKIAEHRLPTASLEQALSLVSASPRTGMLYFEGSQPYLVVGDREVLGLTMPGYAARCIDADGLPATPVLKANIFLDADFDETAAFAAMLNERVDGLDFDVPLPGYLNIMPSGWNKGSAVLALCEHLGIGTDEVAVFVLTDEAAAKAASSACQAHVDSRTESSSQYCPDQVPKLEAAVIRRLGSTVLLAVGDTEVLSTAVDELT